MGAFFRAWQNANLPIGNHDYQIVATEGYFSSGSARIVVGSGGTTNPPTTSQPPTQTSQPPTTSQPPAGGSVSSDFFHDRYSRTPKLMLLPSALPVGDSAVARDGTAPPAASPAPPVASRTNGTPSACKRLARVLFFFVLFFLRPQQRSRVSDSSNDWGWRRELVSKAFWLSQVGCSMGRLRHASRSLAVWRLHVYTYSE
jgi:hypothetical protein